MCSEFAGPGVVIQGNFIGVTADGTAALGNAGFGVLVTGPGHRIGGTAAGAGNVISANGSAGVGGSSANGLVVDGNFIGTDLSRTIALGNFADGIVAEFSTGVTIGEAAAGNVVVGNGSGITLETVSATSVTGNTIAGSAASYGLRISGSNDVTVAGNFVGTDAAGDPGLGNLDGIQLDSGSSGIRIGVVGGGGTANVITSNLASGVTLFNTDIPATGVSILGNSIFDNGSLGIDLGNDGVTPNDPGDADTGPNDLQNFPVLTGAVVAAGGTATVSGTLNSTPSTTFTIEVFANAIVDGSGFGEGQTPLGTTSVTTDGAGDGSWSLSGVTLPAGENIISATATNPAGSTSEFSQVVAALTPTSITTVASGPVALGGSVSDTVTVTGSSPTGSVSFRLFGPDDATCSGEAVFTSFTAIEGGTATSASFTPVAIGTYRWTTDYSGDATNAGSVGACNDPGESVVVGAAATTIATTASPSVTVGGAVSDTARSPPPPRAPSRRAT